MSADVRHILSLSGGKDSAALAVYMRDRVPQMEYIFHDTEKELPETYEYLARLEALLGKPVQRTSPHMDFDHWLKVYGGMLPSNHRRWCTKMLKLKPFEAFVGDGPVINYIGLRADEERVGYISHKPNITASYPFKDDGLVRADIIRILEDSGLGLPPYMSWGRSRSGCYFCFYQQHIEWVRLKEQHPHLYESAKEYEMRSAALGKPFYWSQGESLSELEKPERVAAIKRQWEATQSRKRLAAPGRRLLNILGGYEGDDSDGVDEACIVCTV